MRFLRQVRALLGMGLLGVPQRLGLVCTTIIGVTCAVGLVAGLMPALRAARVAVSDALRAT